MTIQRAIILLCQMYLPCFDEEEQEALTMAIEALQEKKIIDDFLNKEMENDFSKIKAQNEALIMIFHVYNHLWD